MRIDKTNNDLYILNNHNKVPQNSSGFKSGLLSFSGQKNDTVWNTDFSNAAPQNENMHPVLKGLRLNADGKIDNSQFTLEELKTRYPADKFDIIDLGSGYQINKKGGGPILNIYLLNGELEGYTEYGTDSFTAYSVEKGTLVFSTEKFTDGTCRDKVYDTKDGRLLQEQQFDKEHRITRYTDYCKDGTVLRTVDNPESADRKEDSPYIDKLVKAMHSDMTEMLSVADNILSNVDKNNISTIEDGYSKKCGSALIEDIMNSPLPESVKSKLFLHLQDARIDALPPEGSALYISNGVEKAPEYKSVELMDDIISKINPENIAHVLSTFENLEKILSGEPEIIGAPEPSNPPPRRSFLKTIANMDWLPQEKKDEYINHIISCVLENKDNVYLDDIKQDIAAHRNDIRKLEVDLVRAINRSAVSQESKITELNGKIDGDVQQGETGDCWLISGLYSISMKPEGAKYLESLVTKDENTGNYIVTLKPDGKPYKITVTPEEIKNASHLSAGDGDMRVWELAFDKYFKEQAYNSDSKIGKVSSDNTLDQNNYDITGDSLDTITKLLYGREVDSNIDLMSEDFNNPDIVYNISFYNEFFEEGTEVPSLTSRDNKESVGLYFHHSYSIVGSDDENIYLKNPHDTSKTYTISRERLESFAWYRIQSFDLNPQTPEATDEPPSPEVPREVEEPSCPEEPQGF